MTIRIAELFAGVGGFRLGLDGYHDAAHPEFDMKPAGDFKTVWANQWEPNGQESKQFAWRCYEKRFGEGSCVNEDIAVVLQEVKDGKRSIPEFDMLVGGFPCQDYSVAKPLALASGIEGKKGVLWWQIRDTLEAKHAPFVLLENVDRLLKSPASQRGRDFGVILACLAALGYAVEWRVVNAAEYGAAQRRRRTFIFAYSTNTRYAERMNRQNPEHIISSIGFFARSFPIEQNFVVNEEMLNFQDIPTVSESFSFEFKNAGYMLNGQIYTANVKPIEEEPTLLRDILAKNVAEDYYLGDKLEKWEYLKGAKKIERTSKTGHRYIFSEGAIAFPDSIDAPARTMLTSESSLNRSTHVIRDPETNRLRLLTQVEAERIQGFDDNWTDTGMPQKFRYFCMGNALVVPMVTRMGRTLSTIMEGEP